MPEPSRLRHFRIGRPRSTGERPRKQGACNCVLPVADKFLRMPPISTTSFGPKRFCDIGDQLNPGKSARRVVMSKLNAVGAEPNRDLAEHDANEECRNRMPA